MKRYKVAKEIIVLSQLIIDRFGIIEKHHIVGGIPAGTEICLEEVGNVIDTKAYNSSGEVKEEKEKAIPIYCPDCGGYLSYVHDCKKDQPKKEKEFNAGVMVEPKEGERCNCRACHKDQPLTPKDVGMSNREAYLQFRHWYEERGFNEYATMYERTDEEFDRLYQEFLKEQLNNK